MVGFTIFNHSVYYAGYIFHQCLRFLWISKSWVIIMNIEKDHQNACDFHLNKSSILMCYLCWTNSSFQFDIFFFSKNSWNKLMLSGPLQFITDGTSFWYHYAAILFDLEAFLFWVLFPVFFIYIFQGNRRNADCIKMAKGTASYFHETKEITPNSKVDSYQEPLQTTDTTFFNSAQTSKYQDHESGALMDFQDLINEDETLCRL